MKCTCTFVVIAVGAYVTAALVAGYVIADVGPWWLPGATVYVMTGVTGLAGRVVWCRAVHRAEGDLR